MEVEDAQTRDPDDRVLENCPVPDRQDKFGRKGTDRVESGASVRVREWNDPVATVPFHLGECQQSRAVVGTRRPLDQRK